MGLKIPVSCTRVSIDPRYIDGGRRVVMSFVEAIGPGVQFVTTDTSMLLALHHVDERNADPSEDIRMVTEAFARVDGAVTVVFSGLLSLYYFPRSREAIWRGIFESLLSRDPPPQDLVFQQYIAQGRGDAEIIVQCTSRWREANPGKQLCLRKLTSTSSQPDVTLALLNAFDDIEQLRIEDHPSSPLHPTQLLLAALRFPSLRELIIENVVIESMDVFDPTIPDEHLPTKPVLEVLDLQHVVVRDTESLHRFLGKLKRGVSSEDPHPLAFTLGHFVLNQKNRTFHNGALFDKAMVAALHSALVENATLEYTEFTVDRDDNLVKEYPEQFKEQIGRVVRASREVCRSKIMKARQLAFLSVVQDTSVTKTGFGTSALRLLNAHVVKLIFELSAPHVYRQVTIETSEYLDYDDEEED